MVYCTCARTVQYEAVPVLTDMTFSSSLLRFFTSSFLLLSFFYFFSRIDLSMLHHIIFLWNVLLDELTMTLRYFIGGSEQNKIKCPQMHTNSI